MGQMAARTGYVLRLACPGHGIGFRDGMHRLEGRPGCSAYVLPGVRSTARSFCSKKVLQGGIVELASANNRFVHRPSFGRG
jgi:hypothetical protein